MKIAIVGTGNVGRALGSSLTKAGHDVTLTARDAEKTRAVASEIGAAAAETPAQAARTADVVILAVPFTALDDVATEIERDVRGKVVIDPSNPLKADYSGPAIPDGSAAERLAAALPDAHVSKAFNTLFGSVQADPDLHGTTVDGLFAADDGPARNVVGDLSRSIGLRPVHVGQLSAARELEALAWLNIRLQMLAGGDWRSAFVLVGAPKGAVLEPATSARA
jgi:NADPH-dependent F420 reductase